MSFVINKQRQQSKPILNNRTLKLIYKQLIAKYRKTDRWSSLNLGRLALSQLPTQPELSFNVSCK